MKGIGFIILLFGLVSCQNKSDKKEYTQLDKMNWIIGNWENNLPEGKLTETWTKANDSTYHAVTLLIKEKDTLHYETVVLAQKGETLLYSPTVKGQNDEQPVNFKLTETKTENEFVFENPKHDYPQKIVYKKVNNNQLVATISGKQQGKLSSESYSMQKK